jgi:hypothetical protein
VKGGLAGTTSSGPYFAIDGSPGRATRRTSGISTPAASALTWPGAGTTINNNRPTLTGTGPLGANVAVLVDNMEMGRPAVDNTGGWSLPLITALSDNSHTVVVKTEVDGLFHPGSAPVSFTVDTAPPDTTINAGPGNNSFSKATTATFGFSSEAGAAFECRPDTSTGPYASCTSTFDMGSLQDGPHRFEVRAVDRAGNVDPSPAVRSWTVDTVPPDTAFDSGPPPLLNLRAAAFQVSSTEAGSTILCKLDGATSFSTCSTAPTIIVPDDGLHVLQVMARDRA